jgi:hypothetical protein
MQAAGLLNRSFRWDLAHRVWALVSMRPGNRTNPEYVRHERDFSGVNEKGSLIPGRDRFQSPSSTALRAFVETYSDSDPRVLRRLEDYERYEQDGTLPDTSRDEEQLTEYRREMDRLAAGA